MTDFELVERVAKWCNEPFFFADKEGNLFDPLHDWDDLMTKVVPRLPQRYVLCVCEGTYDLYDSEDTSPIALCGPLFDLPRAVCELIAEMEEK